MLQQIFILLHRSRYMMGFYTSTKYRQIPIFIITIFDCLNDSSNIQPKSQKSFICSRHTKSSIATFLSCTKFESNVVSSLIEQNRLYRLLTHKFQVLI